MFFTFLSEYFLAINLCGIGCEWKMFCHFLVGVFRGKGGTFVNYTHSNTTYFADG